MEGDISRERSGPEIIIRKVSIDEIEPVACQTGHENAAPAIFDRWRAQAAAGEFVMFAAYDGGEAVASVNLLLGGADEQIVKDEIGDDVPMVNALGVNDTHRRLHIAYDLMRQCEDYVRSRQDLRHMLALGVRPDNDNARRLYEKLGYIPHLVQGNETYVASWPEIDAEGNRVMFSEEAVLMVKQL